MYNDINLQYIEAIKLAAGGVQYKNLSIKQTFISAIRQLQYYYDCSEDVKYLEVATLYIQAYMEMGFPYDSASDIFNDILKKLGTTREIKFPKKFYSAKLIKLNKSQVRSMIDRWPASVHQKMKINELVDDIISKVQNKNVGIFYYQCMVTQDMYELVINEKEIFFHDWRGIFYTFVE